MPGLARVPEGITATVARKGGWTRVGTRRHFRYLDGRGRRITDPAKLERIEALAIPPAWKAMNRRMKLYRWKTAESKSSFDVRRQRRGRESFSGLHD